MQKQGWLSMISNLFLLVFFFSALPLPSGISERLGLTPLFGANIGAPSGQVGGNLGQKASVVWLLSGDEEDPKGSEFQRAIGTYDFGSNDIICSWYEVYGNTLEELHGAVTDIEYGAGSREEKEGKRYAADVFANYTVDYSPYLVGFTSNNGEMAVELGASVRVNREIHMRLPHFKTTNPDIRDECRAEESRLFSHEMEHVKTYRLCAETMQDSIASARVIGHGPNIWSAYKKARFELDKMVDRKMDESIELANNMNWAIDKLTTHGLGTEIFMNTPRS